MNGKILAAAKAGNLPEVQKLIGTPGININHTEWNGDTALSNASSFGHIEVLCLLISAGAEVNSYNKKGESALMQACSKGYLNVVNRLIEHNADINHQSKTGYSALMMATIGGHAPIVEILLAQGADIALHNNEGKTAVNFAQTEEVRVLLETHHAIGAAATADIDEENDINTERVPSTIGEGASSIETSDKIGSMDISGKVYSPPPPTETAAPPLPTPAETAASPLPAFKPRPPPPRRPSLLSSSPTGFPAVVEREAVQEGALVSEEASEPSVTISTAPPTPAELEAPSLSAALSVETAATTEPIIPAPPPVASPSTSAATIEAGIPAPPLPMASPSTSAATTEAGIPAPPAIASPSLSTATYPHCRSSTGHSKSTAVSTLFGELIQLCGSPALDSLHLPYTVLYARLRHLCATFESVKSSALVYKQDCITEYYAMQLEPILTHAKSCIDPNQQRKALFPFSINYSSSRSDQKLLSLFQELDCDLTKLVRGLINSLLEVDVTDLTLAIQPLVSLVGPTQIYMLPPTSDSGFEQVATPRESDEEDLRLSLLEYTTQGSSNSNIERTKKKDGRLFMCNLHRPVLHTPLRRPPSRRHFTAAEEGYGEWTGLGSLSGLCSGLTTRLTLGVPGSLRGLLSPDKEPTHIAATKRTSFEQVPEEWFQDSDTGVADKQQLEEAPSEAQLSVGVEEQKWQNLPNLAVASEAPSSAAGSPMPGSAGRATPKRISNSVFARLGNLDPSKTLAPGARPILPGAVSPFTSPAPSANTAGTERLPGGLVKADSIYSPMTTESAAATTTTDSFQALASAQLERATTTRPRRAPAKKKFEAPASELPVTLVVVPITVPPSVQSSATAAASSSVKTPTRMGAALKSLFKSRKGSSSTTTTATTSSAEAAGTLGLQDTDTATSSSPRSPVPGTGTVGTASSSSISTLLTSLFSSSKAKPKAHTQSAVAEPSDFSRNLGMMSSLASAAGEDSPKIFPGDSELLSGGLVIVQNIALSAEKLPVIGAAAVLMLQLIDLCDAYRCNQRLFSALKARLQFMYGLYFAEGGIAEIAHKKGKDSVMAPFAKHLEILLLDAISYLTAFTQKGFFHKLMSGRKPQQRFMEIDADVTKCLNGLTTALQLLQVAEISVAYEQLQIHTRQNACIYEAVADVQRKVDRCGGLQGVRSMGHTEMKRFADELGVRDVQELCDELADCEERLESSVDRVSGEVWGIKAAVAGEDSDFKELREFVEELQHCDNTSSSSTKSSTENENSSYNSTTDLSQWKLLETPTIDRNQRIGTGAFGSVYCGTYLNQPVAVKLANINTSLFSPESFPELQREVRLHLRVCGCAGVVKILAVSLEATPLSPEPCVVMERALGSMHDYLHKQKHRGLFLPVINFSLTAKLTLALQVASAMEYISAAGLIHRDIKSSNVLIFYDQAGGKTKDSDPDVCAKICDFGLSKMTALDASINMSSHVSVKGTPSYLSPEAFNAQYSTASDVYAYGVLLNELLTEEIPVPASSTPTGQQTAPTIFQLRDAVCRDAQRPALYSEETPVAETLRALITQCWAQNPSDRYTFANITVELNDILRTALRMTKYGSRNLTPSLLDDNSTPCTPLAVPELSPTAPVTPPPPPSILPHASITLPPPPPPRPDNAASLPPSSPSAAIAAQMGSSDQTSTAPKDAPAAVTAVDGDNATTANTGNRPSIANDLRDLDSLTVEEVGTLMDAINLHALKDVLVSHRVSGAMLACCESVEDLLSPEFGLQSRGLAGGLLRRIQDWLRHGVAL